MAVKHPRALAALDQGRAALAELVAVAGQMLARYPDEDTALMVVDAYASTQPLASSAAAAAAVQLAKTGGA